MPDRRKILLDSVKKLVALGVSDEEIIMHLKEVGISESEAQGVLAEAKGVSLGQIPSEPSSGSVLEAVQEEMQGPVEAEPEPTETEPVFSEPEPTPKSGFRTASSFKPKTVVSSGTGSRQNLSELWEKGILQTVTDKLQEMKRLHDEIEKVIDSKVEKSVDKEIQKMDALFKSQQTLQSAKMNAALETKTKEVTALIDLRIAELKKMKEEKKSAEIALSAKQDLSKQTFERLSQELSSVQKERNAALQEFNSELIKAKSKFEELVEDARQKLTGLEERATQTLELETSIIDGMVKDSQNRIDRLTIEKMDDLAKDVRQALTEFEAIKTGFDFQKAEQQLQRFEATRQKIENQIELSAQSLSQRMEARLEKELQPRLKALQMVDSELKEMRALKEELKKEFSKPKEK